MKYYNSLTQWLSNFFSQGPLNYEINSMDPFSNYFFFNEHNPNIQISRSLLQCVQIFGLFIRYI